MKTELAWQKKLSVGNAVIDSEHRNLMGLIDSIESMIGARDSFALPQVFGRLEQWLCVHFTNENHIASSIDYDFTRHRLAQQNLLKDIRRLKDSVAAGDGGWPEDEMRYYSGYLKNQLIGHITDADMQMKPALQHLPYDFLPESGVYRCECGCRI